MPDQPLTRASVQTAISTKLGELKQLNDVLNVEIYELAARAETAEIRLADQTEALRRALEGLRRDHNVPGDDLVDQGWRHGLTQGINAIESVLAEGGA